MKLLKLSEISVRKCVRHINQLHDIGNIPYNLIRPILVRMNAKQLSKIEGNSPQLLPYTDEIWGMLVAKDFPSRPNKSSIITNSIMPNKQLYETYSNEQEMFRKDSTERLKKMTQRLKAEKLENGVVEVEQILRDPKVKSYRGPKNSILNKARRELEGRSLMFPGRKRDVQPMIRPVRRNTPLDMKVPKPFVSPSLKRHHNHHEVQTPSNETPPSEANDVRNPTGSNHGKDTLTSQPPRPSRLSKRKPSIFLTSPRKRPPPPPTKQPKKRPPPKDESPEITIKRIKSLVFN